MRKFWNFKNATEAGVGELYLYGIIGSDDGMGWLFDEISPKSFRDELEALGPLSRLDVFINSEGGDTFAGQTIYSILRRHDAHVRVRVDGLAASIASVVAMAGDEVIMPSNSMMMVHNPWTVAMGDASEFRQVADKLDQVRESIVAAYQRRVDLGRDELVALLEAETWLTASEAVELGFADKVDDVKIAASMLTDSIMMINGRPVDLSRLPSMPGVEDAKKETRPASFADQASHILEDLASFEERTRTRIESRHNAGRSASTQDLAHWRKIQDAAFRILDQEPASDEALTVFTDYQRILASINGAEG